MSQQTTYNVTDELLLGRVYQPQIPQSDQDRQRREAEVILQRLQTQPGVILADEVGMGKTFVALAVACCVAKNSGRGPVVIMTPPNLIDKWVQDLKSFCNLYLDSKEAVDRSVATEELLRRRTSLRYGAARHSVDFLKLMDDDARERCHIVFLSSRAMSRQGTDPWIRLALVRESLRRHGRGRAEKLIQVKAVLHRFIVEMLKSTGRRAIHDGGEELWQQLLGSDPATWKDTFNLAVPEKEMLNDDPVPRAVIDVLATGEIDLKPLAQELENMPLRASANQSERIADVRRSLQEAEREVWKKVLAQVAWRSPLLVLDEAHHLKNPAAGLAKQLQSPDTDSSFETGEGSMSDAFDRMLFLTATPFQLGHQELISVLHRFGDIRWHHSMAMTKQQCEVVWKHLETSLTEAQRSSKTLLLCWKQLPANDGPGDVDVDAWWQQLKNRPAADRSQRQNALVAAFEASRAVRAEAQEQLRPWIVRHDKGEFWGGAASGDGNGHAATKIRRRDKIEGAGILADGNRSEGLQIPAAQLLPFFLAARSAVNGRQELLSEALCSSYEAFRTTRTERKADRDEQADVECQIDLSHSEWYLSEFDTALQDAGGLTHPKVAATVECAVDLWEEGEKVLVFAFYRRTCAALRQHISAEIQKRTMTLARRRLAGAGRSLNDDEIQQLIKRIHERYFDRRDAPGRISLDSALTTIVQSRMGKETNGTSTLSNPEQIVSIMRRFLRVQSTLVRCFPIHDFENQEPDLVVKTMLDRKDRSGQPWRTKFKTFVDAMVELTPNAREEMLDALSTISTGLARVKAGDERDTNADAEDTYVDVLANVQVATGETPREQRSRQMLAFNTPFFPDIFVCSEVMGEGVDLHRYCRHVIHHDLTWNPSHIEQRTGRIDRLGCKAQDVHPIHVYLPYIAGAYDERQFRVMAERDEWFRIVMGQEEVARLIAEDADSDHRPPPKAFTQDLAFRLSVV
ncbi:MAG: SNF2-related protein [Planctomycetaceae bacterium]